MEGGENVGGSSWSGRITTTRHRLCSLRHVSGSSRPGRMVTIRDRLSVRERLIIRMRRSLHLCKCLWRLFFRMRNIHTLHSAVYFCYPFSQHDFWCDGQDSWWRFVTVRNNLANRHPFSDPLQIGCIGHECISHKTTLRSFFLLKNGCCPVVL